MESYCLFICVACVVHVCYCGMLSVAPKLLWLADGSRSARLPPHANCPQLPAGKSFPCWYNDRLRLADILTCGWACRLTTITETLYHRSRKDRISHLFFLVLTPIKNVIDKVFFFCILCLIWTIGFHNKNFQLIYLFVILNDYFFEEMCFCYFIFILANNFIFHLLC